MLLPDPQVFLDKINSLGIPGVKVQAEPAVKCGIRGTHMEVLVNGMEEPPKSGKYYCRFDCDGAIIKQLAWWDGVLGTWSFKDGGAKIDAKCLGWFPLPEDDDI